MKVLKIIAVKTLETCDFFYKKNLITFSNVEIKIELFITRVRLIEINCLLNPSQAKVLAANDVFPEMISLTENFEELRLKLRIRYDLCEILASELDSPLKANPVDLFLSYEKEPNSFLFRNLEYYDLIFSVLAGTNTKTPSNHHKWEWNWYIPEVEL